MKRIEEGNQGYTYSYILLLAKAKRWTCVDVDASLGNLEGENVLYRLARQRNTNG